MTAARGTASGLKPVGSGLLTRMSPLFGAWFLPTVAAIVIFVILSVVQSGVATYLGISLVLAPLLPLVFATIAQMFVVAGGDIDLGLGSFIGLVNVIFAVTLAHNLLLGVVVLIGLVAAYAAMGVLIAVRRLPSIIVTLGMSFVWLGVAIMILPTPGGAVPQPIVDFVGYNPPLIPGVICALVIVTVIVALFLSRSRYGAVVRGSGSNAEGVRRAGWSVLGAKVTLYALAGVFALLSGLFLSGQTAGADPNIAQSYVLLSIAGVVVGGGTFSGGDVSAVGTVAGALVIGMLGSLLQFLGVASDFQVGAQGLVLVLVLVLRAVAGWIQRRRTR
jgi:ribose transport system permease protein